jgi:hypothetical protein
MKGITVLYDMVTEYETHAGFLIDENHAVFRDHGKWIMMVRVEKTESPIVYRQCGGSMMIGKYAGKDLLPKIIAFVVKMKQKTAYQFYTETIITMDEDIQFKLV